MYSSVVVVEQAIGWLGDTDLMCPHALICGYRWPYACARRYIRTLDRLRACAVRTSDHATRATERILSHPAWLRQVKAKQRPLRAEIKRAEAAKKK